MENLEFKLNSRIKKIAIKNSDDEVITVLKIDISDTTIMDKLADMMQNAKSIASEYDVKINALKEKYNGDLGIDEDGNVTDEKQIIDVCQCNNESISKLIGEIDKVFGKDTVKNVFAESYALNKDYMPDMPALIELLENLLPIMNKLMGERTQANMKKYSAKRKGGKK